MIWFILASGPSMTRADAEAVRGNGTVIAINNTILHAPWADVLWSSDVSWWVHHSQNPGPVADALREFRGRRMVLEGPEWPGVESVPWERGAGHSDPIRCGNNSGHAALSWAVHQGARTVVLLGYDMQHTGGKAHWHDDHPKPLGNFAPGMPELCQKNMRTLAADLERIGVRVINCTRETALTCFERRPLEDLL